MPKISLIVPVYNTSKYLNKCLDSLVSQSLKDIEIIIINDGSTDNSEKIIHAYKDKRIKYISKKNEGIGKTRNLGISKATGEYVAFVDSDDFLDRDFCFKMYEKATKDKLDIVMCDYYEKKVKLKKITFIDFENTNLKSTPELINNINLGPCNKIYKNSLLKENKILFEENLKYEDAPFVIKAFIKAKKIGKVNECLTYYVIHEKSETTTRDKRIFDIIITTDIIVNSLKENKHPKDSIVNLAVLILTDYTIQSRYINEKDFRNKFIEETFSYLNNLDQKWRKCSYLKKFPKIKRTIKSNKILTKIYCKLYKRN